MNNRKELIQRIKDRIAFHANNHRHTYEIGKGVMDYLAMDLVAVFRDAGGLLPPVRIGGEVYIIYRRKATSAKVTFIGVNEENTFFFNVLRGDIKSNFATYQFTEHDIGRTVFLDPGDAAEVMDDPKSGDSGE